MAGETDQTGRSVCHTLTVGCGAIGYRGNARLQRELRRRKHIELIYDEAADEAGGAVYARRGRRAVIVISPGLDRVQRSCAIAHELVHDDIGIVSPPAPEAIMERIEDIVDRRTADWFLPPDQLEAWARTRGEVEPVTAAARRHGIEIPPRRGPRGRAPLPELPARLGVERTPRPLAPHGTTRRYDYGCSCGPCRQANRAR